jgi:hypothetical protein
MVPLLKNSANGIYVLESTAATNDDWITDHAGDPGEADLALYTSGTEYIFIGNLKRVQLGWSYKHLYMDFIDGETFTLTYGEEEGLHMFQGIISTQAAAEAINRFGKTHNRTAANKRYLVWKLRGDNYFTFYDNSIAGLSYAKGILLNASATWLNTKPATWLGQIVYKETW